MEFKLWDFLALASVSAMGMLIALFLTIHARKMKQLEIEALKLRQASLQDEVNDAVEKRTRELAGHIEVLEAIVTEETGS